MRFTRNIVVSSFCLALFLFSQVLPAQLGFSLNLKKPKEYDERVLRSEKSDQGRFTLPKRFLQNTFTHFNYYYNAGNKLNEVMQRAKEAYTDDYSQLLPFYNYSLDRTAADSVQLDSITYKASTGIALHDLRNDWTDNLYLLWGVSFYLQKKFDSAYLMFQFINYAYAPKEKDGYYLTIGSARDGNSALSIATKEKRSLPKKIFSEPPSRNDAFIWQIRTFLAQDQLAEAASLIITLRNDPAFPKRLQNDLEEVQAFWYYKQNMWDSAALHLTRALSNAASLQEKARWEYLAGQLFEQTGNNKEAEKNYQKVIAHSTDLVLEIYARLATIRTNKDKGEASIEKNVAQLLKMARQDKYEEYQDIIYYMAAQMQLEGNQTDDAIRLLQKSTSVSVNNPAQRNKAFRQLAELHYERRLYRQAHSYYDSMNLNDPSLKDAEAIMVKKKSLTAIAASYEIMYRQDSLQRIAALPEAERKDFVKKLVKELRKQQGLKDEAPATSPFASVSAPDNLFSTAAQKGEWYFYNAASKNRGLAEFRSRWGNRPNADSWRRSAALTGLIPGGRNQPGINTQGDEKKSAPTELTFDALYAGLPLTEEQMKTSNDSLQEALYTLGKAYIQEVEDCGAGIETLERLYHNFPGFSKMEDVLFSLYYCCQKTGNTAKAEAYKKIMSEKFTSGKLTAIVATGKNPELSEKESATKKYEQIYDLFIEGKFSEALEQKKDADEKYGTHYWTPQLLYIEAIYHIRQRNDSIALQVLNQITGSFASSPLAPKAALLAEVLGRRAQIEEELRNMVVQRATDSTAGKTFVPEEVKLAPDTVSLQPNQIPEKPAVDSGGTKKDPPVLSPYSFKPDAAHYVLLVLHKVDPVFVNETKNAFSRYHKDTYYNKNFSTDLYQLNDEYRVLLIAAFATADAALSYVNETRPRTATEIIPWLKGGKYSFLIATDANFNLLKEKQDVEAYRIFLDQYWPGKF